MAKPVLTEAELNEALCYDLSIRPVSSGKEALILMCEDKERSTKLMKILSTHPFNLQIFVDEHTGHYSLQFDFIEDGIGFQFNTGKTEKDYPPLVKLKNNSIAFITTGIWTGKSDQGRTFEYNNQLMRLGLFEIGKAFSQADEVQFVAGRSEDEPAAVILVYSDYDHVFDAEADESYNRLLAKAISQPLLEIKPSSNGTVDLKVWDILVDLDVDFGGLKYDPLQLEDFLSKSGPEQSFAFALGMIAPDGGSPVLLSTKRETTEFITLYGYTYIKEVTK